MAHTCPQPALNETWTPFWGPIERLGERGIVLYLQGRDYKAEDALALIDLLRFVPRGCQERVRFVPMQANLQLILHLREIQHAMREMPYGRNMRRWANRSRRTDQLIKAATSRYEDFTPPKGLWTDFWQCLCAFAAESTRKLIPRRPPVASQIQLGLADAENLLIIGRPEYYTAWWHKKRLIRELVCRAGYPSRYAFPDRGGKLQVARPIGKALFDRKWLLQYGQIHGAETTLNVDYGAKGKVEHDYGLVLHSQVIYKGTRKKVTVCVGCHALGTWAATRFIADPALFRQLADSAELRGEEFPLEILLRVKKEMHDPNGLVGMNDLTSGNIRILNNDPREYLGQLYDPPCDACDPKCGAGAAGQPLRLSNTKRQRSDIGRSLRDLRRILIERDPKQPLLDATQKAVLGGLLRDGQKDPYDVWKEENGGLSSPPALWRVYCPCFSAQAGKDTITVTLSRGEIGFGEQGKLIMGPRLFALLWDALMLFRGMTGSGKRSRPYRPILVLGESGSGKDPLVGALRHAWHYLVSRNSKRADSLFPPDYPLPINTAEMLGPDGSIAERLKTVLRQFVSNQGTLFLDEFSDMGTPSQVSLLRLLQDGDVSERPEGRLDPNAKAQVHNALIIAATSQPLEEMAKERKFREDLLFRFRRVNLPILAKRPLDALAILAYELSEMGNPPMTLAALKLFLADPFEGNVRTLLKETAPRIREIWNRVRRRGGAARPILRFKHMAEALKLPSSPSGLGEQLFDEPQKSRVTLAIDPDETTRYKVDELMSKMHPA